MKAETYCCTVSFSELIMSGSELCKSLNKPRKMKLIFSDLFISWKPVVQPSQNRLYQNSN